MKESGGAIQQAAYDIATVGAQTGDLPAASEVCVWHIRDFAHDADAKLFPELTVGIWQIDGRREGKLGAHVLHAKHCHDDSARDVRNDPQASAAPTRSLHHADSASSIETWRQHSHPHMLTLYGATSNVFVCEHGQFFHEYVEQGNNRNRVFRVFYDVLLALLHMHERGCAHGAVDCHHIVLGDDGKAKLLTHFGRREPESEEETKSDVVYGDNDASPLPQRFLDDESSFWECFVRAIAYANSRGADGSVEVRTQCLDCDARELVEDIIESRSESPKELILNRFIHKFKDLADRETEKHCPRCNATSHPNTPCQ